ncbi:hypothetical protein B0I35DRAFT_447438 [Stachybotrys elegans]|uniref:BTB domain-containing protein n=1 Tax=Stachybotrys elegans TaxID=80388 RepID=A0A8K0WIC2_9HYPO|nr:hypothetical protein B0I35DRAFT_447438 [Stachybotrys elegans]
MSGLAVRPFLNDSSKKHELNTSHHVKFLVGPSSRPCFVLTSALAGQSSYFDKFTGPKPDEEQSTISWKQFDEETFCRFVEFLAQETYNSPEPLDFGRQTAVSIIRPIDCRPCTWLALDDICPRMHRAYLENALWEKDQMPEYFSPPNTKVRAASHLFDISPRTSGAVPSYEYASSRDEESWVQVDLSGNPRLSSETKGTGKFRAYRHVFMSHVQMYELADHCDIVKLKFLSLQKLDAAIHGAFYTLDWSMDDLMDTVRYCYSRPSHKSLQKVLLFQIIVKMNSVTRYDSFWTTTESVPSFNSALREEIDNIFCKNLTQVSDLSDYTTQAQCFVRERMLCTKKP